MTDKREQKENTEKRPIYEVDNSHLPEFCKHNAVANVKFIPIEQVQANDYNPNAVARNEMRLLYLSIFHDTYTMPVVCIKDESIDKYVIVDGFHRYTTMRTNKDIYELNNGYLPCVVLDKDINERMASTVRHNRARGKHSVAGMSTIVFDMLQNGKSDQEICQELGLEAEELARLKHITGFSKLFEDTEYGKAWETDKQLKYKKEWKEKEKKQNGNAHRNKQAHTDKAE